jgi:hypothetical protein
MKGRPSTGFHDEYTINIPGLVNVLKQLLKMAMEIVDLPSHKMVDLSSALC